VRGEVIGAHAGEHAAVAADRGPEGIQDHCVRHDRGAYTRQIDEFAVFVLFGFIVAIGLLLALGRWYPGSGAEQVDWRPTRSPEVEAELELDDVDQMLEAQNARRRASGRPERTEEDVRIQVAEDERWREELRRRVSEADDG
jgi:hypothetical protein